MIRRAHIRDIAQLGRIINDCAELGVMLHRSLEDLYEHARDFHVIEDEGQIVGVCGLSIIWADLAEVYALAIVPSHRSKGLGRKLVQAAIEDAQELGLARLMSLTYERAFFKKLGFEVVDRLDLPMKVWSECAGCPKNQACDEIAMIRQLDVPPIHAPKPASPLSTMVELPILIPPAPGSFPSDTPPAPGLALEKAPDNSSDGSSGD